MSNRLAPLGALALLLAASGPAAALDAAFEGRWRVVEAQAAPWQRTPSTARPLLRSGVIFAEGRMRGLSVLDCGNARYDLSVSAPAALFQGALQERPEEAAERLGLSSATTVLNVACDTGLFSFHQRGGDLLFALNNVIYTLRRPSDPSVPADDDSFLARVQASFDCDAARTTAERLICSHEPLTRADRAMTDAYRQLVGALGRQNADALRTAHRDWLAFMRRVCGAAEAMPANDFARRETARCLTEETELQAALYGGIGVVEGGGLRIEPRLRVVGDARRRLLDIDALPVVAGPAPRRTPLQAFLDRSTRRPPIMGRGVQGTDVLQTSTRDYVVHLLDERLVSVSVTSRLEAGTRVPPEVTGLNWDLRRNRPLELSSLFRADADWPRVVMDAVEQVAAPHEEGIVRDEALHQMRDIGRWSFEAERAIVRFSALALPLQAEPVEVEIPSADLRALLAPDAPWQPAAQPPRDDSATAR